MKRKSGIPSGAGRHAARKVLQSEKKAQAGYLLCSRCHAEYHAKHWYSADSSLEVPERVLEESICSGCYRVERRICNGEVVIEGLDKLDSIENVNALLKRVEYECWLDNPTSRILATVETEGKLEIKTTTAWLARRIGRELNNAFGGRLDIELLADKEMIYVHWIAKE